MSDLQDLASKADNNNQETNVRCAEWQSQELKGWIEVNERLMEGAKELKG